MEKTSTWCTVNDYVLKGVDKSTPKCLLGRVLPAHVMTSIHLLSLPHVHTYNERYGRVQITIMYEYV